MDFNELQSELDTEYKQRKLAELKTLTGIKKSISGAIGSYINKVIMNKKYQYIIGIVLAYILVSGLYFVFSHLVSWFTVVVVTLCLLVIYWDNLKWITLKIKTWIMYHYIGYKIYTLKQYICGIFKSKK